MVEPSEQLSLKPSKHLWAPSEHPVGTESVTFQFKDLVQKFPFLINLTIEVS